jgi:hypothetical protein
LCANARTWRSFGNYAAARDCDAKIIAKIEDQQAVTNLHDLIDAATGSWWPAGIWDRVPVRGTADHPAPDRQGLHPARQARDRRHSHAGVHDRKPDAHAAEVTDVANAVFEQADSRHAFGRNDRREISVGMPGGARIASRERIEQSGGAGYAEGV